MGKSGAVLGIIGILIGAGGLALGYIAWNSMTTMQAQIDSFENPINVFYTLRDTPFLVSPATTVLDVPGLNISFDLSSIATVYFSFTCRADIEPTLGTSTVYFFFAVDGVSIVSPATRVGNIQGGSTEDFFSVNLQHLIENMAAGSHNVSVRVSSESTVNVLSYMTLYVQTFMPE